MRNQLSAGTIRELLCLNNWSTQGLVKMEDLKEAATLPEVLDGEAEDEFEMFL